jgi:hypothetical protein
MITVPGEGLHHGGERPVLNGRHETSSEYDFNVLW